MHRRRLDQTAFGLICVVKHVQRACLILTPSTRAFHRRDFPRLVEPQYMLCISGSELRGFFQEVEQLLKATVILRCFRRPIEDSSSEEDAEGLVEEALTPERKRSRTTATLRGLPSVSLTGFTCQCVSVLMWYWY